MRFSFVLPAWKGKYLMEAVQAILDQSYQDFELVVVDDCSPENLKEIVLSFDDARISYHRNEKNLGAKNLVDQWNHCLTFAKGNYIILATDDDLYEPNFLEEISGLIDKYPNVDLLRCRIMQIMDNGKILGMDGYYKENMSFSEFVFYMMHGMKSGIPQYVFKRIALVEAGGFVNFPHAWASDDASAINLARNGAAISNKCLVKFRINSGINITSNQNLMPEKTQALLAYYKWLKKNLSCIKPIDDYHEYLYRNTVAQLPIKVKLMILQQVEPTPLLIKLKCWLIILKCSELVFKNKLSIFYRTL